MVGAIALAEAQRAGWFGKVVKPDGRGTSNVGIFGGKDGKPAGDATNVVTDYVHIRGEARSPEAVFAATIAKGYEEAFAKAKAAVTDHEGATAELTFSYKTAYPPFELDKDTAVVRRATKALQMLGIEPTYLFSNGGLDANWLDKHGVPTITIGAGQAEIHTIKEYVNLAEYEKGCRLGVLMAILEE
jgi:tripeptide aminopeptidase